MKWMLLVLVLISGCASKETYLVNLSPGIANEDLTRQLQNEQVKNQDCKKIGEAYE